MIITLNWLKEFLDTDKSINEILNGLINLGLEVESVTNYEDLLEPFIIAEILHAEKHPNADSLKKCKVYNGKEELDIVCGAPNARTGIKVVLAPIGSKIPANNMIIKESIIRGEKSQGMLCSAQELNLSDNSNGIIEIDSNAKVGEKFIDYKGLRDVVIDISITPNRSDCLGVYGIARDLAALGIGKLKALPKIKLDESIESPITTSITAEGVKYFAGRYLKGAKNGTSPKWLKNYLTLSGHKAKNLFVDVTNYINLSFARPLHVYDADKISGNLTAKYATNGEKFKALNGEEYVLSDSMVVISDDKEALSIAGVIGGESSSSTENTTNIFLEAACFEPEVVINSGRKLCINTDSRYRFERGVDIAMTDYGLDYAAYLINKYSGGEVSKTVKSGLNSFKEVSISVSAIDVQNLVGIDISQDKIVKILESLGFSHDDGKFTVPSWRHDVQYKEDLIEEIIRIYGYDNIPTIPLPGMDKIPDRSLNAKQKFIEFSKNLAASRGFQEIVSWSFLDENLHKIYSSNEPIKLANPISSELGVMRTSIIPNMVRIIRNNEARGLVDMSIFEMGPIFRTSIPGDQETCLALARAGMADCNHYLGNKKYDVLDIKADVMAILSYAKIAESVRIDREVPSYYHPAKSGRMTLGKEVVAYFGELHPSVSKHHSLKQNIAIAEIFMERLPEPKSKAGYKGSLKVSDFPAVHRKFSFIIPETLAAASIIAEVKKVNKDLIKSVKVFDYVKDLPILEANERILGLAVMMQSDKETLSGEIIEENYNKIIEIVVKMGAKFRQV